MNKNTKFGEKVNFLRKGLLRDPSSSLGKNHYDLVT